MAASVRIEDEAFSDARLELLGEIAGYNRFEALGRMAHLWRVCTQRQLHVVSDAIVNACLGPKGADALIASELGESAEGGIRVRGTIGRIEWLEGLRARSRRGGEANASRLASQKEATRKPEGSHTASQNEASRKAKRSPPSPAPAPSKSEISPEAPADWGARAGKAAELIWYEHCDRHAAMFPNAQPRLLRLPTTQGFREIRARLEDYAPLGEIGLAQFEADARHVIAVQEADAKAKLDARYFGEGMWRANNFATAKSIKAPGHAAVQTANRDPLPDSYVRLPIPIVPPDDGAP